MRRFGLLLLLLTLPALSWAPKVALDTTLGTIVIQLNARRRRRPSPIFSST